MIGQVIIIQGEIIQNNHRVQLKIAQPKIDQEIDQKKIKAFLREVDLDLKYYTNLPLLHQASLEYHRVMGSELRYNKENAQQWIQSIEFIKLSYALRWVYQISSQKDREEINIVFDPKDQILKTIILLNIGLEQKKEISLTNLLLIVSDNSEILYGLSLYIQKRIEILDLSKYVPLLLNIIQEGDKTAINQLIIIELIDKVLSKFSGLQDEQVKKLKLTNTIIQQKGWEEGYQQYTLQEMENPYFQLRKTKQVYLYTKDQYEVKINLFKSQWEDQLSEMITSNGLQLEQEKTTHFTEKKEQNEELNTSGCQTNYIRRRQLVVQTVPSQPNLQIQGQTRVNFPPPPPPKVQSPNIPKYDRFNYAILKNQLDGTIWKANVIGYETLIDKEILRFFEKKDKEQIQITPAKTILQRDEVEYENSVFQNQMEIEVKRRRFKNINLDEILEQVNQLEFLEKNQRKNIIELLNISIELISEEKVKEIEQNIKKTKQRSNDYRKRKLEEEDSLQKQERERLKSLQQEVRAEELLILDQNLNCLQNDLQAILKENELSELESKLEKLKNDLNRTDQEEQKNNILQQFESLLFNKQKFLKSKNLENYEKYQISPNDSFLKYLYDKNPRKAIQIEAFYDEHLDRKIYIMDILTEFSEVLKELNNDVELILYFKYIQEYGKVFNNIQVEEFGLKFVNVIYFSYQTYQLKDKQVQLTKYIVDLMVKQGIPFKDLEDTPFRNLPKLSKSNNDLTNIPYIIHLYANHLAFLKENQQALSSDEKNKDFIKKTTKYSSEYNQFIFQLQTIYEWNVKNIINIRHFFCDDRNVELSRFFEGILAIKNKLRFYYRNKIQEDRNNLLLKYAQNKKIGV